MSGNSQAEVGPAIAGLERVLGAPCLALLRQSPDSIWILNFSSEILYYNHAEDVAIDLIGRPALDFLKVEFHQHYRDQMQKVLGGETVEFDFHSVLGQVWMQRFVPIPDLDGEIRWVFAFGREREQSLKERSLPSHVGIAVGTTGMGVWRWDAASDLVGFDRRASVIHGLSAADSPMSFAQFIRHVHVEDRERVKEAWHDTEAQEFQELEYRRVFSDGSLRWISCSATFIVSPSASAAAIGSCFDITERKLVSDQLVQSQKMDAIGQLTAGIAHNFNNILSAILPNLHLAARFVSEDGAKFVRNAHLAAERATDLVTELMVVAGRKESEARQTLDLYDICERVTRICRTTFGGWVQLELICEGELPLVLCNESQIEQVLLNLLLNSRDAFEEASISCPRITIELEAGGESEALMRVIDNGPGMSEHTRQRIFEPFFTTRGAGTGLGLATASAIISDHGGTIECWSEIDLGTRFEVRLPAHEGEVRLTIPKSPSSFIGGCERILVVDDDCLVRRVTSATLRDAGYDVVEAAGGSEAINVHREGRIDLVVLDMAMPELTGDQVLAALRVHNPATRVLIFTGLASFRKNKLERVAILQKPAGVNELLQAVRREIDQTVVN